MRRGQRAEVSSLSVAMAIVPRVFCGLMVDTPDVHNGAYLSVLLGTLLALPAVHGLQFVAERANPRGMRGLRLLLAAWLSLDAAALIDCTAASAGYVAFAHVATRLLALPLLAAALRASVSGERTVVYAANLLVRASVLLLVLLIVQQLPYLRASWLAPVLGFGTRGILRAGVWTAARMTGIAGAFALLFQNCQTSDGKPRLIQGMCLTSAVLVFLIVLRLMMAPSMGGDTMRRLNRLDALLTNGRAPLYSQLPMITVWFVGTLHAICFECCAAGAMLRQSLPALKRWGSAILSVGPVALLTLTGLWKQALDALPAGLEYGFLLGGICLSAAANHLQPGGRTCE